VIGAEEYCLLECKNQIEEAAESGGSGLVGFHMKGVLRGGPLLSLRTGQTRPAVSTVREAPSCQNVTKDLKNMIKEAHSSIFGYSLCKRGVPSNE